MTKLKVKGLKWQKLKIRGSVLHFCQQTICSEINEALIADDVVFICKLTSKSKPYRSTS